MRFSIIGCGAMGSALATRLCIKNELTLFDHNATKLRSLADNLGAKIASKLADALLGAEVVLLAIKPKDLEALAKEIQPQLSKDTLVISVLAGVKLEVLSRLFPKQRILRTMPNLAVSCQKGVVGVVETPDMSKSFRQEVEDLFEGMGLVVFLPENKVDALTSLTASAPAFILHLIEAMTEGGIYLGFPSGQSLDLVLQVFEGAIALVKESKKHPAALKWEIASPGGSTIEGLKVLEEQRVHFALIQALQASYLKATKMLG